MIPVTKPYLPSREKLNRYIDGIYERAWLTNNGELVQELTKRLEEFLEVENLLLVANGTLALQIAYRVLGISGRDKATEAITTPFTFVATASSLKWEGVEPVFADIDPDTWCLDPASIEAAITLKTRAIVPVHVFGNACNVESISAIAQKHNLKVIYDASHAFGVKCKGESLLKHGDAATLSFHATKLFHTGEGGAIVFKRKEDLERAKKMISFGISEPETIEELGINAKMNELQAAMGLCILDDIDIILATRAEKWKKYSNNLKHHFVYQKIRTDISYNHSYFPLLLKSNDEVKQTLELLYKHSILARRYFYPSLETTKAFFQKTQTTTSFDIANRVICIPLFEAMTEIEQEKTIELLNSIK